MASHHVEAVEEFKSLLGEMLEQARLLKQTDKIEPALNKADFGNIGQRILSLKGLVKRPSAKKTAQYAVVETAVRDAFNELLASECIDQSGFVRMWNLLDIVSFFSDDEQCDPALLFWLVEEILDSQTIAGCRKVFDYLESRRERITAKHFSQKNLVILRTCNELLKRLSRAEDTAFCGRVFIFMFQSFPLGDKSSVNLRGEYHVENVTSFDENPQRAETLEKMDVDVEPKGPPKGPAADKKPEPSDASKPNADGKVGTKTVTFDATKSSPTTKPLDSDELYPIFWSLQRNFSQPKTLFDSTHFSSFKKGLEATLIAFEAVQAEQSGRGLAKSIDNGKRGTKRKRGQSDDELANTFNPKYLTSGDLFELEISDLSFRRHIAVQALIILDFLLSLSPKAKEKLAKVRSQNKSVMYQDQVLSEEDTHWAVETKKRIADYLKKGVEGPFFYRMVETVLSRDKNWVRWKIENCPSIVRPAISSEDYVLAKTSVKRAATSRRLRPHPQMSLDLKFLIEAAGDGGMEKLKKSRFHIPTLADFQRKIADDDFEIEMPTSEETKERAINGKASKSWRALRIASKSRLATFDKIDDPEKIDIVFAAEDPIEPGAEQGHGSAHDEDEDEDRPMPSDRRPLVISGAGNDSLVPLLMNKYPKTFSRIFSHTTRAPPADSEPKGTTQHHITQEEFAMLRDGDQLLEFVQESDGVNISTSRKAVESIVASGRIPILEMDHQRVQQLKDQSFSARYMLLAAAPSGTKEHHIGHPSSEEAAAAAASAPTKAPLPSATTATDDVERSQAEGFYDIVIPNNAGDAMTVLGLLEHHIFDRGLVEEETMMTGTGTDT